jgi:anti-sigma B factor antagonist
MEPSISVREDHLLTVRSESDGCSLLVRASGEIDFASAAMLEEELGRALGCDASVIALDLGDVEFIDVTGLGVLVAAAERFREEDNRLSMWLGSGAAVRRLVELCGVEGQLPLTG